MHTIHHEWGNVLPPSWLDYHSQIPHLALSHPMRERARRTGKGDGEVYPVDSPVIAHGAVT